MTVRFCERYIDPYSRTKDQMIQAARSGVQNIAEGSEASATSKETELKLTQVARASLEELRLDYEDFLRQRNLPLLEPGHPSLLRFKELRCVSLGDVREWLKEEKRIQKDTDRRNTDEHKQTRTNTDEKNKEEKPVLARVCPCGPAFSASSVFLDSSTLAANAALSLLNLTCYLLDRLVAKLAQDFTQQGGFTERLYRVRSTHRSKH
jgi:four helix bundle suffix protein